MLKPPPNPLRKFIFTLFVILTLSLFILSACGAFGSGEDQELRETQLKETELEVNVQQTLQALQNTQESEDLFADQQATLQEQGTDLVQGEDATTTGSALNVNATQARETDQANLVTQTQAAFLAAANTPEPVDLATRMQSAKILLFEDMTANLDTNRYVKDTLDSMGLPYVDVGSAKGWLKNELLSGGPEGQGWDLIIIAAEAKKSVSGEFFEYVSKALDDGASVILEVWYLDQAYSGTASSILARCGVSFDKDWRGVPPSQQVMFPLEYGHPVLNEPNSGLAFTDVTSYWWDPSGNTVYDIGDLMKTSLSGDAKMLVGVTASDPQRNGTVTVCIDGRLILQTFSSHQLTYNEMRPVWENYIYNTLNARFK